MTRTIRSSAPGKPSAPILILLLLLLLLLSTRAQEIPPRKFAVMASAAVQESPPQITLNWPADAAATGYVVNRRGMGAGWAQLGTLPGNATSFSDSDALVGNRYEYQLIKSTSGGYTGYGYIQAGIRASMADHFGKVVLVIENSIAGSLAVELATLESDLTLDGWAVLRRNVSMNDSPAAVKQVIKSAYESSPGEVRAVFLFGHVPVPYSGDIAPDGHANHQGAWPADVFYGDMDGTWTDNSVTSTNAEREVNWNLPGDGKYDQSEIPSALELMVGRVDLHNMTCYANKPFARSEVDLLRQYLNKNHAFRRGEVQVQRRALVCDNFSDKGSDPIGGSAWRNFPAFVGANQIEEAPWDGYLPAATSGSYLWSYASGGGSYYYSMGVGTSDDFALNDLQVVFTMFMGSYFGDWNNESNFLRASLGSGLVLAASYSGFPHALYFPMGLGEPIGYGMLLSQNNGPGGLYPPWNQGTWQVHVSLHGDPTLRLFPVKPISNLTAASEPGTARLNWSASPDTGVIGYHVYRATSPGGPFEKITSAPLLTNTLADTPSPGTYHYMVRAIKLEETGSGTFLNPSGGILVQATVSGSVIQPPASPVLAVGTVRDTSVDLNWNDLPNETGYQLEAKVGSSNTWAEIASPGANTTSYTHSGLAPGRTIFYRLRAFNTGGTSPFSPEVSTTTLVPIPGTPSLQAGSITHSQVVLQWNDVSDETGYSIERRVGQGSWFPVATPGTGAISFSDLNVTASTEYYYRIKATGPYGDSAFSPEVLAYTQPPPLGPPVAPTLQATALSERVIELTWNDLGDELGYRLQLRTPAGEWTDLAAPPADSISFLHSGLTASTTYTYRIRAFNQQGFSGYSAEVSAETKTPPLQIPPAPVLTSLGSTHSEINLDWVAVEGATGYKLERKSGTSDWTEITLVDDEVTMFSDNTVIPSTTYGYRLRAFNDAGNSSYSAEVLVTTPAPPLQPPAAPILGGTVLSHTAVELTWAPSANAVEHRIEKRLGSGAWTEIATIGSDKTNYVYSALSPSTSYSFRLRASNAAGSSAYSDEVTLITEAPPLEPPATPVLQAQPLSHAEVVLTWNDVESETEFTLQRKTGASAQWTTIAIPNADTISFLDSSVAPETTYSYRVQASNRAGSSAYSTEVTVAIPAVPIIPPAAPSLQANAISADEVQLAWQDVENETNYVVERRPDGADSWVELSKPSANATSLVDTGLSAETTYFYRIRAVNGGGVSAWSETTVRTPAAPPQVQSTATFVRTDTETSGLWPMEYGAGGVWIPTQTSTFPEEIIATLNSSNELTFAFRDESRALIGTAGTNRVAAAWSAGALLVNLNIPRGTPRTVALYFVDWNQTGATQEIFISDFNSGTNLDTRSIENFKDGKYLVYRAEGNIAISIQSSEGDAVLSGLFIGDAMPAPINNRPLTFAVLGAGADSLRVRISGDSGQRFKVQASADFRAWTEIGKSILVGSSTEMNVEGAEGRTFFRTVNIP